MKLDANNSPENDDYAQTDVAFIDTKEASRITGIPVATLVTWRSRGRCGPPFYTPKGTRRVLYERGELIDWAKGGGRRHSTADRVITRDSSKSHTCNVQQGHTAGLETGASIDCNVAQSSAMDGTSNSRDKQPMPSSGAEQ